MNDAHHVTPREAGFSMPPEWEPHAATIMAWPDRAELWGNRLADAVDEYAGVARAIAAFEPVIMVCNPGMEGQVRDRCGSGVEPLPIPIDDAWMRDSGPIFVRNGDGGVAAVNFRFNGWGGRFEHAQDDLIPVRIAEHLGMRAFSAPFVLEGGAFFVDGEGTLLTTEMCLLNENRNPTMSREQIEQGLRDYLGVETVMWLPHGQALDTGPSATDGHVDGVAQYVAPGEVMLLTPPDPGDPDHVFGQENLQALRDARDARGRAVEIRPLDVPDAGWYANCYLANGVVIAPMAGIASDAAGLARLGEIFPDREVVGVSAVTIAYGGGGPHCITQQVPVGAPA